MILWWMLSTAKGSSEMEMDSAFLMGMWSLNTWALTNIATGAVLAQQSEDPKLASFHQMNAGWNIVNAGLASAALVRPKEHDPRRLSKVFWINAGADVLYVLGGIALQSKGIEQDNTDWEGWGSSIVLQGSFLFVFDGIMGWSMYRYSTQAQK